MKKIFLSIALVTSGLIANAQLEVGGTLAYGTTWMLNKSLSDSPDIDYKPSFGLTWGAQATMFFNHKVGAGIEMNFATVNQNYEAQDAKTFDAKEQIKFFEIPLLLKLKTDGGFYFELGPKFNFAGKSTQDLNDGFTNYTGKDISKGVNSSSISFVLGFGGRFALNDILDLAVGLRFADNINDVNKELKETPAQLFSDVEKGEIGVSCYYGNVDKHGDINFVKTNMLTGHLQAGLIVKIGGDKK